VAAAQRSDPLARVTIVVGTGALARSLPLELAGRLGGVGNLHVLTLHRLAHQLASSAQQSPPVPLPGIARRRLARVALARRAGQVDWFFGGITQLPGLAVALVRTFDDLREAGVDHEYWPTSLAGRPRTRALAELYRDYSHLLDEAGLADAAAVYRAACAAPLAGADLGAVFVYGLYDFPPVQEMLLRRLAEHGASFFVPAVPSGGDYLSASTPPLTPWGLDEVLLAERPSGTDAELLRRSVFEAARPVAGHAGGPAVAGDGSLQVVSAADEQAELVAAARELLAAAAGGTLFHRMALVVPDGDREARAVRALGCWRIPAAGRLRRDGPEAAAVAALLDCLAPASGPAFARPAVLQLAATVAGRLSGVDPEGVALWVRESQRAGIIGGADGWTHRLTDHLRASQWRLLRAEQGLSCGDEEEDGSGARLAAAQASVQATEGLLGFTRGLVRDCARLPASGSWPALVVALLELVEGHCGVPHDAPLLADVGALASLEAVEREVSIEELAAIVREVLDSSSRSLGAVGRRGVAVVRPEGLRGHVFDVVVFTGLSEGGYPPRPQQDPLLLDEERRELAAAAGSRLPLAADRDAESRLLFALALGAARRRVVLSHARGEAGTGKPRLPSRFFLRACEALAGRPVSLDDLDGGAFLPGVFRRLPANDLDAEPLDVRQFDVRAMAALAGEGGRRVVAGAGKNYFAALTDGATAARAHARRVATLALKPGAWDAVLSAEALSAAGSAFDPFSRPLSASALQRYIRCPFQFYVLYVLGFAVPEEPEEVVLMEAVERGIVMHAILESVVRRLIAEHERPRAAGEREHALAHALQLAEMAAEEQFAAAEQRGTTGVAFLWRFVRGELAHDALAALAADACWEEAYGLWPRYLEERFGANARRADSPASAVSLELVDGSSVAFSGRIDRIDVSDDGRRLRVVDYKSGSGSAERDQLKSGLNVQLPLYVLAALALAQRDGLPADDVRSEFRYVTRRGGLGTLALEVSTAEAVDNLRTLVTAVRALVRSGIFARTPASPAWICERCDMGHACDEVTWVRERKRASEELGTLVELQAGKLAAAGEDVHG
jgi:ATP-dependent helicase/nuclease subunit B